MAESAHCVSPTGPMRFQDSMTVFAIEGNMIRQYNSPWTIRRLFQAAIALVMMGIAFLTYAEIRYRFYPTPYFNESGFAVVYEAISTRF